MFDQEKAFDISNPPKSVTAPGVPEVTGYVEFPRHLHRADGSFLEVSTDREKSDALADGWFLTLDDAKAAGKKPAHRKAVE